MFTILFTMVGVLVFVISLFTAGLKSAAKRLGGFAVAGLVLDVILIVTMFIAALLNA